MPRHVFSKRTSSVTLGLLLAASLPTPALAFHEEQEATAAAETIRPLISEPSGQLNAGAAKGAESLHINASGLIEKVAKQAGFSTLRMPSGAGHDAQSLGYFGIPIGMIFVPSKDGISHSPREWADGDDCTSGAEVLYRAVLEMDRS